MNIGQFTKTQSGVLAGHIATASIDLARLALRPVTSTNERAPAFEVVSRSPGGRVVQIGAVWEAVSNSTGELFLQGSVDDPSLTARLPIALFADDQDGYRVAWRRPQRRAEAITARTPKPSSEGTVDDVDGEDIPF